MSAERADLFASLAALAHRNESRALILALRDACEACRASAGQDQRHLWQKAATALSGAADDVFRAESGASTTLDTGCSSLAAAELQK